MSYTCQNYVQTCMHMWRDVKVFDYASRSDQFVFFCIHIAHFCIFQ